MADSPPSRVTRLLEASAEGDADAASELLPLVYDELRQLAQAQMGRERRGHTLTATALVHEAYLKLVAQDSPGWKSRAEFFSVASVAMRRILVDHARARRAQKRGGSGQRLPLDDEIAWFEEREIDLVDLDMALRRLGELDAQKARLVELRFFAGLPVAQAADLLDLSKRTAEREWTLAKAWLRAEMQRRNTRNGRGAGPDVDFESTPAPMNNREDERGQPDR